MMMIIITIIIIIILQHAWLSGQAWVLWYRQTHHVLAHWHDRCLRMGSGHTTGTSCRISRDKANSGRNRPGLQGRNWTSCILP